MTTMIKGRPSSKRLGPPDVLVYEEAVQSRATSVSALQMYLRSQTLATPPRHVTHPLGASGCLANQHLNPIPLMNGRSTINQIYYNNTVIVYLFLLFSIIDDQVLF